MNDDEMEDFKYCHSLAAYQFMIDFFPFYSSLKYSL